MLLLSSFLFLYETCILASLCRVVRGDIKNVWLLEQCGSGDPPHPEWMLAGHRDNLFPLLPTYLLNVNLGKAGVDNAQR